MSGWIHSFSIAFQSVAQLFLLGLIGWVAVRRGIITEAVIKSLAALMIDLLIPGLMFMAMLRGYDAGKLSQMSAIFLCTVVWVFAGFGLAWLGGRIWPRPGNPDGDRAIIAMVGIQNSFYLPMPLVAAMLPPERRDEGLLYIGASVIALSTLNWIFAPSLLAARRGKDEPAREGASGMRRILLNPPLLGIAAGCLAAQIPFLREAAEGQAEGWAILARMPLRALDLLTPVIAPLAMILLGAVLASHPIAEHHRWRSTILVGVFRLLVIPGLVLLAAHAWIPANSVFFLVLAVEAGAPPATNLSLIAIRYGDQGGHVSSTLLTSYLLSLLTLPMWIGIVGAWHPL